MYNMETGAYAKYAAAGVSEYALRHYPQFVRLAYGTNAGLSWYNSFQVGFQRRSKSFQIKGYYTYSKSLDNVSNEGNGFTDNIDNYNLNLNKARSDFDRPHVFSAYGTYTLPIGNGHAIGGNMPRWANTLFGGWDAGGILIWQSGAAMTASSGRFTAYSYGTASWDNYRAAATSGRYSARAMAFTSWTRA